MPGHGRGTARGRRQPARDRTRRPNLTAAERDYHRENPSVSSALLSHTPLKAAPAKGFFGDFLISGDGENSHKRDCLRFVARYLVQPVVAPGPVRRRKRVTVPAGRCGQFLAWLHKPRRAFTQSINN